MKRPGTGTVAQRLEFDEIIDVRSPAEFADDHIPGAINCPVLNDAERAEIGTLYKQVSPFEASKRGAALISRAIGRHLEERFLDRPKSWRPLIVCWRGGQRSLAMALVFAQVGWRATQLEGGYKAWRRLVLEALETLPGQFDFRIIGGPTGSGKSRLLRMLGARGAQILDLEALAHHKGSVLGGLPNQPQPSQKAFESSLYLALAGFDPARPVFVEAESRTIGRVYLPNALLQALHGGRGLELTAELPARIKFLLQDYDYALADPDWLLTRLESLKALRGREMLQQWQDMIRAADWPGVVKALLIQHYDPLYRASQARNYRAPSPAGRYHLAELSETSLSVLATTLLQDPCALPTGGQSFPLTECGTPPLLLE